MPSDAPKTIDEYIKPFPPEVQERLEAIRKVIHEAAPAAQEAISYAIPTFTGTGIGFAAYKYHIGMYPVPALTADLKKQVAPYLAEKSTLQFLHDEPLPLALIRKVVAARIKQFKARKKSRP